MKWKARGEGWDRQHDWTPAGVHSGTLDHMFPARQLRVRPDWRRSELGLAWALTGVLS